MSRRIAAQLPDTLLNILKTGSSALLLTVGEDGFPNSAFTWVVAINSTTIHFGADHGSATLANLERDRRAALQIIGEGNLIFLIKGNSRQVKPQIEAAPFKIAMVALDIAMVKDQSWPGVSMHPLVYDWSPEQRREMLAMERAVYAEMREWQE